MDDWAVWHLLICKVLERAVIDWRKTCSHDQERSEHILFMLDERHGSREWGRSDTRDIFNFCIPYGGPCRELTGFFNSDWCDLLFSATSVNRDTVLRELNIT